MPKVSDEYKARKREALYQSALECFAEKGFQLTTMDDIVVKSKTSKGLIYNYFKSKEELYISLVEEKTSQTFEKLNERFRTIDSAEGKLKELFRIYRETPLTKEFRDLINVYMEFWVNSSRQDNLRTFAVNRYKNYYLDFLVKIIKEGIDKKEFNPLVEPEVIGAVYWATIDGISVHYGVVGEEYKYRETIEAAERMLMNYIKLQI